MDGSDVLCSTEIRYEALVAKPSLYSLSLQGICLQTTRTHMRSSPLACASFGISAARSSHPRPGVLRTPSLHHSQVCRLGGYSLLESTLSALHERIYV